MFDAYSSKVATDKKCRVGARLVLVRSYASEECSQVISNKNFHLGRAHLIKELDGTYICNGTPATTELQTQLTWFTLPGFEPAILGSAAWRHRILPLG